MQELRSRRRTPLWLRSECSDLRWRMYLLPVTFSPRRAVSVFEPKPLSLCAGTSFLIAARVPSQLASGPRTRPPLAVDPADVVEAAEYAI